MMKVKAAIICRELKRRLLSETEGKILSVFRHAVNVITPSGFLFTLLSEGVSEQPHSIVLAYRGDLTDIMKVKENVQILSDEIRCKNVRISFSQAEEWEEQVSFPKPILQTYIVRQRNEQLPKMIVSEGSISGLSPVLWKVPEICPEMEIKPQPNIYCNYALNAVRRLFALIQKEQIDGKWEIPESLIGLGPGLTPSGDDFFAGVMSAALYYEIYQGKETDSLIYANRIRLEKVCGKTNLISGHLLRLSAEGKISADFHNGMRALFSGEEEEFRRNIRRILCYGASSGSDFLSGVYAYLCIVLG